MAQGQRGFRLRSFADDEILRGLRVNQHTGELSSTGEGRAAYAAHYNAGSKKMVERSAVIIRNDHFHTVRSGSHLQAHAMIFDNNGKDGTMHFHPGAVVTAGGQILQRNLCRRRQDIGSQNTDLRVLNYRSELAGASNAGHLDPVALLHSHTFLARDVDASSCTLNKKVRQGRIVMRDNATHEHRQSLRGLARRERSDLGYPITVSQLC